MKEGLRLPQNVVINESDSWQKGMKDMVCLLCNQVVAQFDFPSIQQLNDLSYDHNYEYHHRLINRCEEYERAK